MSDVFGGGELMLVRKLFKDDPESAKMKTEGYYPAVGMRVD